MIGCKSTESLTEASRKYAANTVLLEFNDVTANIGKIEIAIETNEYNPQNYEEEFL